MSSTQPAPAEPLYPSAKPSRPLGILLTGGASSRMGVDKSRLVYRDQTPEYQRLYNILEPLCEQTFLVHRSDQSYHLPCIHDEAQGPLAAIGAVQSRFPQHTILVLACDLPLLETQDLEFLLEQAEPADQGSEDQQIASCFLSPMDGRAEPLCCLYTPASASAIQQALAQDQYCPRHVLEHLGFQGIKAPRAEALRNGNTPGERKEILSILNNTRTMKTIQLRYFAQLQEQANKNQESYQTHSITPSGVYDELVEKYAFTLKPKSLLVAVNEDFTTWDTELKEGDELVFIPPVAGG